MIKQLDCDLESVESKLTPRETILPSIVFFSYTAIYNLLVQIISFLIFRKDDECIIIGIEMIGTSFLFLIPILFISCKRKNVYKCYSYVKIMLLSETVGLGMIIGGTILIIVISLMSNWTIISICYCLFGILGFGSCIMWTYFTLFIPLKDQIKSLKEIPMFESYHQSQFDDIVSPYDNYNYEEDESSSPVESIKTSEANESDYLLEKK